MNFFRRSKSTESRPRRIVDVMQPIVVDTAIHPEEYIPPLQANLFFDNCRTLDDDFDNMQMPYFTLGGLKLFILAPEMRENVIATLGERYRDDYHSYVSSANAGLQETNLVNCAIVAKQFLVCFPEQHNENSFDNAILDKMEQEMINGAEHVNAVSEAMLGYVLLCEGRVDGEERKKRMKKVVVAWLYSGAEKQYNKIFLDCVAQCLLAFPEIWEEEPELKKQLLVSFARYKHEHGAAALDVWYDQRYGLLGLDELFTVTVLSADRITRGPQNTFTFHSAPSFPDSSSLPPRPRL